VKRIFHTWDKWECYPAGFYEDVPPGGMDAKSATAAYADFLRDSEKFRGSLVRVLTEWPNSCEHYLSNVNMNRIAWLGQAGACIALGLPACFRSGFHLLSEAEQEAADDIALEALNLWLMNHGEPAVDMNGAASRTKANLY